MERGMRIAGTVLIAALFGACTSKDNDCRSDSECPAGAYCVEAERFCVGCPVGQHPKDDACVDDTVDACGPKGEPCPVPPAHGTATCTAGQCGYVCDPTYKDDGQRCVCESGYYDAGGVCMKCNLAEHCGASCEYDCTQSGEICDTSGTSCVPGPHFNVFTNSVKPNEPMVKDNYKGLIWQGCAAGLSGDDCMTGTVRTMIWWAAADDDDSSKDPTNEDYCSALDWGGYNSGWRLPTQPSSDKTAGELSFILADCPISPLQGRACIDNTAFPNTPAYPFWSSSSVAVLPYNAWGVYFESGYVGSSAKSGSHFAVRCVRSGP